MFFSFIASHFFSCIKLCASLGCSLFSEWQAVSNHVAQLSAVEAEAFDPFLGIMTRGSVVMRMINVHRDILDLGSGSREGRGNMLGVGIDYRGFGFTSERGLWSRLLRRFLLRGRGRECLFMFTSVTPDSVQTNNLCLPLHLCVRKFFSIVNMIDKSIDHVFSDDTNFHSVVGNIFPSSFSGDFVKTDEIFFDRKSSLFECLEPVCARWILSPSSNHTLSSFTKSSYLGQVESSILWSM